MKETLKAFRKEKGIGSVRDAAEEGDEDVGVLLKEDHLLF